MSGACNSTAMPALEMAGGHRDTALSLGRWERGVVSVVSGRGGLLCPAPMPVHRPSMRMMFPMIGIRLSTAMNPVSTAGVLGCMAPVLGGVNEAEGAAAALGSE